MSRCIFVRHGQSTANLAKEIATPSTQLTEEGMEQARCTGQELRNFGITHIVSSPCTRAIQTAEIIAREIGLTAQDIEKLPDLAERDLGDYKGKPKLQSDEHYLFEDNPDAQVEQAANLVVRMQRALHEIAGKIPSDGTLLVVGHAVSGYYLRQVSLGAQSVSDFDGTKHLPNADYIEIEIDDIFVRRRGEL